MGARFFFAQKRRRKGKDRRFCLEDKINSIPCRASCFPPGRFWGIGWYHPFLQIILVFFNSSHCKTASAAMNLTNYVPQTAATTFAFSTVFILLLCLYPTCYLAGKPCMEDGSNWHWTPTFQYIWIGLIRGVFVFAIPLFFRRFHFLAITAKARKKRREFPHLQVTLNCWNCGGACIPHMPEVTRYYGVVLQSGDPDVIFTHHIDSVRVWAVAPPLSERESESLSRSSTA